MFAAPGRESSMPPAQCQPRPPSRKRRRRGCGSSTGEEQLAPWERRAMAEVKQRNPVTTGWTVAIVGLLVALLLGLGLMRIGKQRMAKAAELARPYTVAFASLAENALAPLSKAQDSVTSKDWGQ